VHNEQTDYWDLNWTTTTAHYTAINTALPYPEGKDLRLKFSINTCQGCHAGDNKTLFTQIRPLGYGQAARYWLDTPDHDHGQIDDRFVKNLAKSYFNGVLSVNNVPPKSNLAHPIDSIYYVPRVSAFLTGRNIRV
jgi:hypothetical protein